MNKRCKLSKKMCLCVRIVIIRFNLFLVIALSNALRTDVNSHSSCDKTHILCQTLA